MHHGIEFRAVFIVCVILTVGAATRHFSRRTGFPYTVAVLLLGLFTGLSLDLLGHENPLWNVAHLLAGGALLSPHLIIFVFRTPSS